MQIRFIDNTDPAGIDHQIAQLGTELATTLVIVISKVCKKLPCLSFSSLPSCNLTLCHQSFDTFLLFLFRVEALQKLEMVCWKSRKPSVKPNLNSQNRFLFQVLVSYSVCFHHKWKFVGAFSVRACLGELELIILKKSRPAISAGNYN